MYYFGVGGNRPNILHPLEKGESLFTEFLTLDSQDRLERVEQYPLYYFR